MDHKGPLAAVIITRLAVGSVCCVNGTQWAVRSVRCRHDTRRPSDRRAADPIRDCGRRIVRSGASDGCRCSSGGGGAPSPSPRGGRSCPHS
eukprot:204925-Prorocentrum_minimum.AAC.1